jgi:hypothetical protein
MIRVLLTVVACLALQSAASVDAHAWGHGQAAIGVGGGEWAAVAGSPRVDAGVLVAVLPAVGVVVAPSWAAAGDGGGGGSHVAIARLWLRGSRLLC